jgi:hypothetical protein
MRHDGVRPLPGPEPAELEDGLPDGPEVPPGEYRLELSLPSAGGDTVRAESPASVLPDPRSGVPPEERLSNYQTRLALQTSLEAAVTAVERITHARADTETVIGLIEQRKQPGAELDGALRALNDQATDVRKGLDELEKRFRTLPETKGITYDDDKVVNQIDLAQSYVASSSGAPSPTALAYVELASRSLREAEAAVDRFMTTELAAFRSAVAAADIRLFGSATTP